MSKLYEYIVSYMSIDEFSCIIWRDILTNKINRHDGPCIYLKLANGGVQENFAEEILIDSEHEVSLNTNKHYNFINLESFVIQYQYVVSYYQNYNGNIKITWKDILTNEYIRHDGPCVYLDIQREDANILFYKDKKQEFDIIRSCDMSLETFKYNIEPKFLTNTEDMYKFLPIPK